MPDPAGYAVTEAVDSTNGGSGSATAGPQAPDPWRADRASLATGPLRALNDAQLLTAADVHVAAAIGRLAHERDPAVLVAVALAVRAVREGSVCVNLEQTLPLVQGFIGLRSAADWLARVAASPVSGSGRPVRCDLGLVYLDRYWRYEVQVCHDLQERLAQPAPPVNAERAAAALARLFPQGGDQRRAAEAAVHGWVSVIGGGPGTGKTTTVARLLAVLLDQPGRPLRIALAAPTGKAAARLQEAVAAVAAELTADDRQRLGAPDATTIHRLLGWTRNSTRFRHDRDNRLPHDVVVIDETSMVSLFQMNRLLEAVRPNTRIVLVGDPGQLASVEAGAVLADLVDGLTAAAAARLGGDAGAGSPSSAAGSESPPGRPAPSSAEVADRGSGVVLLTESHRFGGRIAELAAAVRDGDERRALAVLDSGADDVQLTAVGVRDDVLAAASAIRAAAQLGEVPAALAALDGHRVLCAHRTGPYGMAHWNRQIERWLAEASGLPVRDWGEWYLGRPLLVTVNDPSLGLYNGDTGVVVAGPDGSPRAVFARGGAPLTYAPTRLADLQTVHAMTVHKSQGSQFRRVTLVLPEPGSRLLTREMLYTGLTRAQDYVRIVGTVDAIREAIAQPVARASGLARRLGAGALADAFGAG